MVDSVNAVDFDIPRQKTGRPVFVDMIGQSAAETVAPAAIPPVFGEAEIVFKRIFAEAHCRRRRQPAFAAERQIGHQIKSVSLKGGVFEIRSGVELVFVGVLIKKFGAEIFVVDRSEVERTGIVVCVSAFRANFAVGVIDAEVRFVVVFYRAGGSGVQANAGGKQQGCGYFLHFCSFL